MVIPRPPRRLSRGGMSTLFEPDQYHLDFELLARYAERSADDVERELVETHAEDCEECRAELDDLIAYVRTRRMPRRNVLLAVAAVLALITIGGSVLYERGGALGPAAPPAPRSYRELQIPSLAVELADSRRMLRSGAGAAGGIEPLSPVGSMLLDDRPTFRWSGARGARYRVDVFDARFHPIASSPELTSTSWRPPQPLPGGTTYVWQITAEHEGRTIAVPQPPAPEARFHVIDRGRAGAIGRLERSEVRPSLGLGVAYAEAGALSEAQRELSALIAANRETETALRFLRTVQAYTP